MRSLNRVMLIGSLGRDAESKFTPGGAHVAKFSIATNRRWKDKQSGEWKEKTNWSNVVLWRSENLVNYLTKGKKVYVEGELETRSYEQDGKKVWITEVVANDVILLDGPNQDQNEPAKRTNYSGGRLDNLEINDSDVPF